MGDGLKLWECEGAKNVGRSVGTSIIDHEDFKGLCCRGEYLVDTVDRFLDRILLVECGNENGEH